MSWVGRPVGDARLEDLRYVGGGGLVFTGDRGGLLYFEGDRSDEDSTPPDAAATFNCLFMASSCRRWVSIDG